MSPSSSASSSSSLDKADWTIDATMACCCPLQVVVNTPFAVQSSHVFGVCGTKVKTKLPVLPSCVLEGKLLRCINGA